MAVGQKEKDIIAHTVRSVPGAERVKVVVFGSQARGDAAFGSDIDVGIESIHGGPLPPGLLSDIQDALDESPLSARAEAVDLARSGSGFRERALAHAVPL